MKGFGIKVLAISMFWLFGKSSAIGQQDVGLLTDFGSLDGMIEYRKFFGEHYAHRIGLGAQLSNSGFIGNNFYIKEVEDSLVHFRDYSYSQGRIVLRYGLQRKLVSLNRSYFTVGADVEMGYKLRRDIVRSRYQQFPTNVANGLIYPTMVSLEARRDRQYLSPGLRFTTSFHVPLGEKFILTAYYAASANFDILVRDRIYNDIYNEHLETIGLVSNFNSNLGIGLRYKIGE